MSRLLWVRYAMVMVAMLSALGQVCHATVGSDEGNCNDIKWVSADSALECEWKIVSAVEKARNSLVSVVTDQGMHGSGVMVSAQGDIYTVAHVVSRAEHCFLRCPNGQKLPLRMMCCNERSDVAWMRVDAQIPEGGWPHCELALDTNGVVPAQEVIALGHPYGYQILRPLVVRSGYVMQAHSSLFRSTCAITLGDSGGGVFDLDGRLVGIHYALSDTPTENFHIPISAFQRARLLMPRGRRILTADAGVSLGVSWQTNGNKLQVAKTHTGSAMARAGMRIGDYVTHLDGIEVASQADVRNILACLTLGQKLLVSGLRGNSQMNWMVTPTQTAYKEIPLVAQCKQMGDAIPAIPQQLPNTIQSCVSGIVALENATSRQRQAMGIIVSLDARTQELVILTKYSEIAGLDLVACLAGGQRYAVTIMSGDVSSDLALLRLPKEACAQLKPFALTAYDRSVMPGQNGPFELGRKVVVPLIQNATVKWRTGIISAAVRPIRESRPVLGVVLSPRAQSPMRIVEVREESGAANAGIEVGDVLLSVNRQTVDSYSALQTALLYVTPGESVEVKVQRRMLQKTFSVELDSFSNRGKEPNQIRQIEDDSGERSVRRDNFDAVVQFDGVLQPQDCGGPLLDIHGRLMGLVLARSGRVGNYALTVPELKSNILLLAAKAGVEGDKSTQNHQSRR